MIAESYERIHRSNLVGMGILPLQYLEGQDLSKLELTGKELYSITLPLDVIPRQLIAVEVRVYSGGHTYVLSVVYIVQSQMRQGKWKGSFQNFTIEQNAEVFFL